MTKWKSTPSHHWKSGKLFKLLLSLFPELYAAFNYAAKASRIITLRIATLMMRHLQLG